MVFTWLFLYVYLGVNSFGKDIVDYIWLVCFAALPIWTIWQTRPKKKKDSIQPDELIEPLIENIELEPTLNVQFQELIDMYGLNKK